MRSTKKAGRDPQRGGNVGANVVDCGKDDWLASRASARTKNGNSTSRIPDKLERPNTEILWV